MTIQTPSRVAAATAPATVFGMSWNFRSRKTRSPRATSCSTNARAVAREQPAADLEAADRAAQRVGQRAGFGRRCRRRARRGADPFAVLRCAACRAVPTRSAMRVDLVALHVVADAVEQLRPDERIDEVGGADLHRGGAGDHELERVARVGDAAHADDRNLHRLAALVHHPHGDRPDRRAAQAADARSRSSAAASRRR